VNSRLSKLLQRRPDLVGSLDQNLVKSTVPAWKYFTTTMGNSTMDNDMKASLGGLATSAAQKATGLVSKIPLINRIPGLQRFATTPTNFGFVKSLGAGAGMTATDWLNNHVVSKVMGPSGSQGIDEDLNLPMGTMIQRQLRNIVSGAIGGRVGGPWGAVAGAVVGNFKQPFEMGAHLLPYMAETHDMNNQNTMNLANLVTEHPEVASSPNIQKMIKGFSPADSKLFAQSRNDGSYVKSIMDFVRDRNAGKDVNIADLRNRLSGASLSPEALATEQGKSIVGDLHKAYDHFDGVQALKGVGLATAAAMGVAGISAWLKNRQAEKEKEQRQQPMLMAPKLAKWVFAQK
jgi:hypothetical protein